MEDQEEIAEEAVNFFQRQFSQDNPNVDFQMLDELPKVISSEKNEEMNRVHDIQEKKNGVMELNRDSTGGLDGMSGELF